MIEPLRFRDRAQWRAWLQEHHAIVPAAVLVIHKVAHRALGLTLDDAVEEALCFGWIDGQLRSLDGRSYLLRFTPRRRNSVWSIRNIRRAERLIGEGRMTAAGLRAVAEAKEAGAWDAATRREDTDRIPDELLRALRKRKGALAGYRALPDSRKKQLVHWLFTAKREQTRDSRLETIIAEALDNCS